MKYHKRNTRIPSLAEAEEAGGEEEGEGGEEEVVEAAAVELWPQLRQRLKLRESRLSKLPVPPSQHEEVV